MTFEMKALDKYSNGTMICVLTGRDFTLTESEGEIPPPDCVVTEAMSLSLVQFHGTNQYSVEAFDVRLLPTKKKTV